MARNTNLTVEHAIKAGRAARKRDEEQRRAAAEFDAQTKKQHARLHRESLREKWVDHGMIFDRIREAVRNNESELHIGEADGACTTLASVLGEVDGLTAKHYTFRMRMADDCPEEDFDAVKVQWSEKKR